MLQVIRKLFFIYATLYVSVSCISSLEEPVLPISGRWAKIDARQQTTEYISISDGNIEIYDYSGDGRLLAHENTIWGVQRVSGQQDFKVRNTSRYSLIGCALNVGDEYWGDVELAGDTLKLSTGVKYLKFENIESTHYSRIIIDSEYIYSGYNESFQIISYAIERPLPWSELKAKANVDWIRDISCRSDRVYFTVASSEYSRTGQITLRYQGAADAIVDVTQEPQRWISVNGTLSVDYKAQSASVSYTVYNPLYGGDLTAVPESDWIKDVQVDDSHIVFSVLENNTGSSRTGSIRLKYPESDDVILTITQTYSESSINTSSSSRSCSYTGGTFSFTYSIVNPREDLSLSATESYSWITDLKHSGNTISFKVSENNSGSSRTGKINLTYGDAVKEYTVTQSYTAPDIVFSPSSTTCPYASGSYSFSYSITNPRESLSVSVSESVDWITNLTHSGKTVSFKVSENNNWVPRTGKITLTYGSLTKEYSVTQSFNGSLAEDLSSSSTANCYIVSSANSYVFKTVKGNSSTSVGFVASIEVLWESFGTSTTPSIGALIEEVAYSEGYIRFTTPNTFREGNAVIAAKDASGKILWSWHIWLTDKPEDQVYKNNAGTMMDRNLGATSATPGDVGALGLLYQWGRKDPFLGSSSISKNTTAKCTVTLPSAVSSSSYYGTISYATAHPTTFIYSSGNYDWYYSGSSSTDDTRWQSEKTIYDPCPPGYRVPDGGVWSKAFGTSSSFNQYAYDSTNKGFNFGSSVSTNKLTSSSSTCWYPAAGFLSYSDGSLGNVGIYGNCWSCFCIYDAFFLGFNDYGYVYPSNDVSRARGQSVRCLRE